ncbi:MAG: metallophosphoesterase [Candidatus Thermoplasmatota archaeon]|jgi:putative SbcD/Mre11-related phosphoesterase|nr:metallophosphoesterase [Candidatus Thermoplasmatota archaeon]
METELKPIPNKPALLINKKILLVADLHIGIESELREQGINTASQTQTMMDHLIVLFKKYKPKEIILLGDIKHNIPSSTIQEREDVKNFLETVQQYGIVHIIPGNHDGNIQKITPTSITIHPSDGFTMENLGFVHGHRWPSEEIMRCEQVIMAHTHPTIMLIDRLGYKTFESCWLKAKTVREKLEEKYKKPGDPQILILPAFNPLCGGISVNKEGIMGPMGKIIDVENTEVYLLDGSGLGKVKGIK